MMAFDDDSGGSGGIFARIECWEAGPFSFPFLPLKNSVPCFFVRSLLSALSLHYLEYFLPIFYDCSMLPLYRLQLMTEQRI